jgi:hypothetical protein
VVNGAPRRKGTDCRMQIGRAALLAWLLTSSGLAAQVREPEGAVTAESSQMAPEPSKDEEQGRKKKRVSAGLLTVALVTATGLALLALTILGGAATRRSLRRPDEDVESRAARPIVAEAPRSEEADESPESAAEPPSDAPGETRTPDQTQE